jgi:hypothetical protein
MSKNHPLIPNAQQYIANYKYCTINSDDRDIKKYPNPAEFDIELPQDYDNVQSVKLNSCTFTSNYDVFTSSNNNTTFIFSVKPYYTVASTVYLDSHPATTLSVEIETGSYTPDQMATELTNKMNLAMSEYVSGLTPSGALYYSDFLVEYNTVSGKLWVGNKNSAFTLNNGASAYLDSIIRSNADCSKRSRYIEYINWGLPYYLGFSQTNIISSMATNNTQMFYKTHLPWLSPNVSGGVSHFIIADKKTILDGPTHFYMEIAGMNNVDETMPYSADKFHAHTNETNGIVNSCFAKIPILTNDSTTWYNERSESYMLYNPPAERIRRIRIKMRHHNNKLVSFDNFEYSFVLQFGLFLPQNEKKYGVYVPETVSQNK